MIPSLFAPAARLADPALLAHLWQTTLDRLAAVIAAHPGKVPLRLVLDTADGKRVLMEADRHAVAWCPGLHRALIDLLGPGCVRAATSLGGRKREQPARRGPPGRSAAAVG